MRKRFLIALLALLLCLGALCVGANADYVKEGEDDSCDQNCIAHAIVPGYNPGEVWRWHFQTPDALLEMTGDWIAQSLPTVTVKFLQNVEVTKTLKFSKCNTHIILDLNGHTIYGDLTSDPVVEVNYNYGLADEHCITFRNGTIKNTAKNGTALKLSGGATTLEDVNVQGDLVLTRSFATSESYTPTFCRSSSGGIGSFTRIRPDDGETWSKLLVNMLGKDCFFTDSSGVRLEITTEFSAEKPLTDVRTKPCDHKDAEGNYTLFKDAKTITYGAPAMQCTVCGNLCTHDEIDADLKCTTCKIPIAIEATNLSSGEPVGPYYYTGLDDAMYEILKVHGGSTPTLKLLANTTSACQQEWYKIGDNGLTIDLAGHTLTLTGNDNKARSDKMKFLNTSDIPGKVVGTVNVYTEADSGNLTLTIPDTHNNLTIGNLMFKKGGTASLAGGGFGSISISEDSLAKTLADLLAPGYCYYVGDFDKRENGTPTLGEGLKTLTDVYVAKCNHSGAVAICREDGSSRRWTCCGEVFYQARVTSNGVTHYYQTIQEAFEAAGDGDTVGILEFDQEDLLSGGTIDISQENLTVEIVGRGIDVTGLYFKVTGKVRFLSAGWDKGKTHYSASFYPPVMVAKDGELTVPEYYDSGNTVKNTIGFTVVTVMPGGKAVLRGGTYHYLTAGGGAVDLLGSGVRVNSQLSVQQNGTLTAENISLSSPLKIYTGTAALNNCTINSDTTVSGSGKLTVNGGKLGNQTTLDGGELVLNSGTISNLAVTDGTVTMNGGVLGVTSIDSGALTMKDGTLGTFTLNGGSAVISGGTGEGIMTVNGGKLTLNGGTLKKTTNIRAGGEAEFNGGAFDDVFVNGKLTLDGAKFENSSSALAPTREVYFQIYSGGEVNLLSGSVDHLYVSSGGTLTVSGGKINTLEAACGAWEKVTLAGGSFGKIALREYEDDILESVRNVTYADFAAMLSSGKGYQKSDGTYAGNDDVKKADDYDVLGHIMLLHSVTVTDAPFTGLSITGDSRVTYGGSATLTAEMGTEPTGKVTYQWYRVTDSGREAIENATEKTYTTDPALDAGNYTYTVEAASNGYVTDASFVVTVEPKVLYPILNRSKLSKVYDGTAIADVVITGFSFTSGGETSDPSISAIKYKITDPHYEDRYGKITANVNEARWVVYTLTLNETNYALRKDNDGKFYQTLTSHLENRDTAITPASIGSDYAASEKRLTILNKHLLKTYELVLADYLPALDGEKTYGDVDYSILSIDLTTYYNPWMGMYEATLENGILSLPILYNNTEKTENVGTIRLKVKPTNYEPFDLIINVDAKNKLPLTGTATPDRTTLTYGEKLSDIKLSGEMKDGDTVVAGTFQWDLPDEVPEVGEYDADWVFEPTEDEKYLPVRGTVKITVSPATYSVTVAETEHGSVSSNRRYASYGQTVTLTVAPEDGYVLETLTVTTRSGKEIALTDLGGGKYSFRMPGSRVTVTAGFAEDNSVLNFFVDVPNNSYYYEAVRWAAENGITAGVDALHFAPDGDCTRAQIATFLWRTAGCPEPETAADFADVDPDAYYAKAVAWAAENGVVLGTGKGFEPDRVCTRAEAAAMIYRDIQRRGGGFTGAWMFRLPFTDTLDWAYEATAWCYMHGITEGVSETEFGSNDPCTRAHIVTFLWRAFGA